MNLGHNVWPNNFGIFVRKTKPYGLIHYTFISRCATVIERVFGTKKVSIICCKDWMTFLF